MKKIYLMILCFALFRTSNIYSQGIPNGRYEPVDCTIRATVVQAFIINGDNFTMVMPMVGTAMSLKYKYTNGTLTLTDNGQMASLPCSYDKATETLVYSGAVCKKTSSKAEYNGVEEQKIAQENLQRYMGGCKEVQPPTQPPPELPFASKGKLIFFTHGLNDGIKCFEETVKSLVKYENYFDFGSVSMRNKERIPIVNLKDIINTPTSRKDVINNLIDKGINVFVRLEFSAGNLSFADQLEEMRKMVTIFHGHNADVVFVGHSMGGLASINYGVEYADTYKGVKNIKIITVSTPYQPNFYAALVWEDKDPRIQIIFEIFGQHRGKAHRDLGGYADDKGKYALSELRNKWIKYKGNIKTIELHTIGVIGSSINVIDRNDRGDGIIDIHTQLGTDPLWGRGNISSQFTIIRNDNNNVKLDWVDTGAPYHHCNTSYFPEVIEQIKKIIEQ